MRTRLSSILFSKVALFYVILTSISSTLNILVWSFGVDGVVRYLANPTYLISIPGWIPLYALGFVGIRKDPYTIVLAHSFAWVFWFILITIVYRCIRRMYYNPNYSSESYNPQRRIFLSQSTFGILGVGACATPGYATLVEPWLIQVRRYDVKIPGLPKAFDGLTVAQLSDLHLGPRIPTSFVQSAINQVIHEKPDLVFLTGDFVHDGTDEISSVTQLCAQLVEHSSIGVIGVLGNHDWWGDAPRLSSELEQRGIKMIDNDRVWIDPKTRKVTSIPIESALSIVGFGDLTDHFIDVDLAFRDVQFNTPTIVLSHNPDSAELVSLRKEHAPRIDLMCSGHTHGGQIRIPFIGTPIVPSMFGSKYAGGLVQGPAFPVHISRGIGMSLLPMRFGVPPEISVITLRSS